MEGTDSESCPVAGFGNNCVEPSSSATEYVVSQSVG
jgi:hypothetical protein